jgi:hypothetical protein
VLLFNAVNKAQRQKADAEAAGGVARRKAAAAKLGKASFMTELRQAAAGGVAIGGGGAIGAIAGGAVGAAAREQRAGAGAGGASWDVLGEGFPGLTKGAKMKDWDRQAGSDDDEIGEQPHLATADVSSDEGDGW